MIGPTKFRHSLSPAKLAWVAGLSLASLIVSPTPSAAQQSADSAPATINLPELGDVVSQDLSPAAERRLGDRIMRSVWPDPAIIDDPLVLEYIEKLWVNLLQSARARGDISTDLDGIYAWTPFLVQDRSVNAFALPGGYIGVHLGLIAMTTTPDELASVLAHELAHVTQRHIARNISVQARQSWVSLASIILGVLAASRDPQAAQAVIMGGQAAGIQGQLNFSRDMEREADRVGFGILKEGGFEPAGMAQMFEHLLDASRLNDDGSYPYLRTHPLTTERIGEARARLGPQGWQSHNLKARPQDSLFASHALMSARARVRMDTRSVMLDHLTQPTVSGKGALQTVAAHYTAALALQHLGQLGPAAQQLQLALRASETLNESQRSAVLRTLSLSQIELNWLARQPETAHANWTKLFGTSNLEKLARPELMLYSRMVLLSGYPDRTMALQSSASALQTHLSEHPVDSNAWSVLGEVWLALDQPIRAVRADAEASAAKGDLPGAIDRVIGAQKRFSRPSSEDVIELSVMDARLRTWQRQHKEDMREDAMNR